MAKWNYGDAYKRHPIQEGVAVFPDGSKLKAHNIYDPLPGFMFEADCIFVDPPWNVGNLNSFYTKADRDDYHKEFEPFYQRLFACLQGIQPKTCYIEVGKEYLAEFIIEMKKQFRQVTFYNSTYYHRPENFCYVIRGSSKRRKLPLDNVDQKEIVKWICQNEEFSCIGDLCMGRGLLALSAHDAGRKFVGTELNHKRLSVTLERLVEAGATYVVQK